MSSIAKYLVALAVLLGVSAVIPLANADQAKDCSKIADPAERAKCEQDATKPGG